MFALKEIIFDLFGVRDRRNDLFKNVDGKGLHQRFNELLADDLDANEISLINLLLENTANPFSCFEKYIPYREATFGTPIMSSDIYIRRKIVAYIKEINKLKGTKIGYSMLFTMVGIASTTIVEFPPVFGFDSPGTFDDDSRVFDQKCKGCSNYSIELTGTAPLTNSLLQSIAAIILYNEPLNADLLDVTYNGVLLLSGNKITIIIDNNGDAIFLNPFDSSFSAYIDGNGDLIISSENPGRYSLDGNGNLIYSA